MALTNKEKQKRFTDKKLREGKVELRAYVLKKNLKPCKEAIRVIENG